MHATVTSGGRLRRALALAVLPLAFVVAACGGTAPSPATANAYEAASKALDAPWDRVKVNVGISATGSQPVDIKPDAIEVVVDTTAGKGSLHLSLPAEALGSQGESLGALGGGDTLDIDALFDGQALYVKSPLAASLLPFLAMQGVQVPSGDLSGWLKLGTAEELSGLVGAAGGMPEASEVPVGELKDLSVADLQRQLEEAGVTVTYVGREQRNGVEADHLLFNVDLKKLQASGLADQLPADDLTNLTDIADSGSLSADVWLDSSSGRPNEVVLHVADGSDKADITVLISDPGDVSLDAPASFVEVPIAPLVMPLLEQFGGALASPAP